MPRHPVFIEDGEKAPGQTKTPPPLSEHPPPEEEVGDGDLTSLQEQPSTDDDIPLD
jgi:hypothetical protein